MPATRKRQPGLPPTEACTQLRKMETFVKTISGSTALLVLALALAGCAGNYKFSDDQYRPLGDPQALNRGK